VARAGRWKTSSAARHAHGGETVQLNGQLL
jgi:hypothetical protein